MVTTFSVDTTNDFPDDMNMQHLRHSIEPLVPRRNVLTENNVDKDNMKTNHHRRRNLSKSSKSKTHKSKNSKQSRDGIEFSMSGNIAQQQYDLTEMEMDSADEDAAAPFEEGASHVLHFESNNEDTNSGTEIFDFSLLDDRIDDGVTTGGDTAAATISISTTTEIMNDEDAPTTTENLINNEAKTQLQPGRAMAIAASGMITLISVGSVLFVTIGLFMHARRNKSGAMLTAAADNNAEDASDDSSSIWSANEGGDHIGDLVGDSGGESMPVTSPPPPGVSSIAVMGMASPMALQLSGRNLV